MSSPPNAERPARGSRLPLLIPGAGLLAGFLAGWRHRAPNQVAAATPAAAPHRARPAAAFTGLRRGAEGEGGLTAAWPTGTADARVARNIEFQYAGMAHQATASLDGMWLFLATELLFFGALFMLYLVYRTLHPAGFAAGSAETELWIGTVNTVLLLTSSAVMALGLGGARRGDNVVVYRSTLVTLGLGAAFLALKGYEWFLDLEKGLFPGPGFPIGGPESGGAQLFWSFYFVSTGLHGIHMMIGMGLVAWIAWAARRGRFSPGYTTPVEAVGLYWSFVDMVWLCLYPMLYLVHRGGA